MIENILDEFGFDATNTQVSAFGSGLINNTWMIRNGDREFILQRINDFVFTRPGDIAYNIRLMADWLGKNHPEYFFVIPLPTTSGSDLVKNDKGYFRIFPFVPGSHTIDTVQDPAQAYEAAVQFGRFTRMLAGMDAQQLRTTIPDFHNLTLRYKQFQKAIREGDERRREQSKTEIDFLSSHGDIVTKFEQIQSDPEFSIRVIHHDTKISNVLFDSRNKGICVIDLDTTMPGYFISDLGDMFRTYLSPVSEEEKDFDKIVIRKEYYDAIVKGYLSQMGEILSTREKEALVYAGKFMIYMQALRFLADYLNNDIYYGSKYEGHNFIRAKNQIVLLQRLMEIEPELLVLPV